jgi:hypothetical protein
MYDWGQTGLPIAQFDGQVYVDGIGQIFRWDAAAQIWLHSPELQLTEARSEVLIARGTHVASMAMFKRRREWWLVHWDVVFNRAFVEVSDVSTGEVYGRVAHISFSELLTWLASVVPSAGGDYSTNIRLRVLQVVDLTLRVSRTFGWNNMYGAMRGRNAMRSASSRMGLGLPSTCGYAPAFAARFPTQSGRAPEIELVNLFVGQIPTTSEPRAIWFPSSKMDLTRLPKNAGATISPLLLERYCWNDTTVSWQQIATTDPWYTADTALCDNPACFMVGDDIANMAVNSLKDLMRAGGTRYITGRYTGVVIYHLRSGISANLHAFYAKPLGISMMAADVNVSSADYDLIAVNEFHGESNNVRYVIVPVDDRRPTAGWRWRIHDAVTDRARPCGSRQWTTSTERIPHAIRYYLRNRTTGIVSPYLPTSTEIARRRYNMAFGFLERRG